VSNLKLTTVAKQGTGTTLADFTASAYSLNTASAQPAAATKDEKKGETNGRKS
jgi:hypothetical protein